MIERSNKGLHQFLYQLIQLEQGHNPSAMLDIAAGSGAWLSRFSAVPSKLGLDLNTEQFSLPDTRVLPFNFDQYKGETWGSFDLVTAIEIIEHLQNPGLFIQLIKNNLSKKGICYITTPNIHGIEARTRYLLKGKMGHFDEKSDPTHIYPVYLDALTKIIHSHHLEIIGIYTYPSTANYSTSIKLASKFFSLFAPVGLRGDNLILKLAHHH